MGARNGFVEALDAGLRMGEAAREAADRREMRKAVAAFSANPDDPAALQEVMARNPELGMKLSEYADKRAFNASMGEYLTGGGQPNALLGMAMPGPISGYGGGTWNTDGSPATPDQNGRMMALPGSSNALASAARAPQAVNALAGPVRPGAGFDEAFAPIAEPQPVSMPEMQQDQAAEPDLSVLGQPRTARDRAFLAMVKRDPVRALKIQSELRDNFMDRLADEQEFYGIAINQLSSAQDEATWQAGLQRLAPMAQALGGDLTAHVPANYPGPEGVQALLEQALPVKERLDYLMREANMEADNARADRNTDSLIDSREARLAEQRRATDRRIATTRRGQDLTDSRVRSGAGRRGKARPTATDGNGRKVEWNGKAWVPVK